METKQSIPNAPMLIESMRSIGYSFQSAIADLIDNSISANATRINISLNTIEKPFLVVLDDGNGMDEEELLEAMRYGSQNPLENREINDLGRFGLGMKSASLSQCRNLTVVSKKNHKTSGYSWNLDKVIETGNWTVLEYNNNEILKLPEINNLNIQSQGTYLLMQEFDRIENSTDTLQDTLKDLMVRTIDHLALVFHQFISEGLIISVNDAPIPKRDPFLVNHKATQHLRSQKITIENEVISVDPYILPHPNKISKTDAELVGGKEQLKNEQGFYIYRNRRLIIWGTWFRLYRKDELGKQARVKVEIPSSLGFMWDIDIKKSSATLPQRIKKNLYACVEESVSHSKKIHEYRGRREKGKKGINYIWERIKLRDDGGYRYEINRNLPSLQILSQTLDKNQLVMLKNSIKTIEDSLPVQALYLDNSKGLLADEKIQSNELLEEVKSNLDYAKQNSIPLDIIIKSFMTMEPYCKDEIVMRYLKGKEENE